MSTNTQTTHMGGGATHSSTAKKSNRVTSKAKIITPLISSVLAVALQATETAPSIATDPVDHPNVSISNNTWTDSRLHNSLIWNLSNDIYTIQKQVNSGSGTNINGFNLRFSNGSGGESSLPALTIESWQEGSAEKAGILVGTSVTSLTYDFGGKGLNFENKTENWTVHFQSTGKTFSITNLKSFRGSFLFFEDGTGSNTYNVALESMEGDIKAFGTKITNDTGTFTFTGSGLVGNIAGHAAASGDGTGKLIVNFNNSSTMTGDIKGLGSGNDALKKEVAFANGSLTGNIISYGVSGAGGAVTDDILKARGNHVTFSKGNMQGSIIATEGNGSYRTGAATRRGYNSVTFSSGAEQTLTGGVLAQVFDFSGSNDTPNATNTINIKGGTKLKVIASESNPTTVTDQNSEYEDCSDAGCSNIAKKNKDRNFTIQTGSISAEGFGRNEINLEENSSLVLNNGSGSIFTQNISVEHPFEANPNQKGDNQAKSIINFNGTGGTLQGNIITSNGTATINVGNGSQDASGIITGNIETTGGSTNIVFQNGGTTKTLNLQGATNAITSVSATQAGTLVLDTTNNGVTTTVSGQITGDHLVAQFNGVADKVATLSLNGGTLDSIILNSGANADENVLELQSGTTTVTQSINVDTNRGLTINLSDNAILTSSLTSANNAIINFNGDNGNLAGNVATSDGSTAITFNESARITGTLGVSGSGTTNITIKDSKTGTITQAVTAGGTSLIANIGTSSTLSLNTGNETLTTSAGNTEVNFNGANGNLAGNVATSNGNTFITFKESAGITGTLSVSDSGTTNLIVEAGKTGTVTGAVTASGTSLTADIGAGSTLTLTAGLTTSAGNTEINFNGASGTLNGDVTTHNSATTTFNLGILNSESATAIVESAKTITNNTGATNKFNINAKSTTLQYGTNGLAFSAGNNEINFENAEGATLNWKNSDGSAIQIISTTGGTTSINFNQSGIITGGVDTDSSSAGSTIITIANKPQAQGRNTGINAQIQGALTTTQGTTTVKFAGGESAKTLTLGVGDNKISSIVLANSSGATENNTLALSKGATEVEDKITIAGQQTLAFDLADGVNLTLTGGVENSGSNTYNFNGETGTLTINGSGIATQSRGSTVFNLGSADSNSVIATISGTLSNTSAGSGNDGENFFAINAKTTTVKSSATFSAGMNVLSFENTEGATLNWKNDSDSIQTISTTGGMTVIDFKNNGTITGDSSTASINTSGTDAITNIQVANGKSGTIGGSITLGTGGENRLILGDDTIQNPQNTTASLILKGATNQITSVTANVDRSKLVLDTSTNANMTTLNGVTGDNKLTVNFNGTASHSAKLSLKGISNKLKAITLGSGSTNNTLEIASGTTSVNDSFSLATGQEMNFDVKANSNLAFTNGLSNSGGKLNLTSTGSAGSVSQTTISGNITTSEGNTNLYFKDSLWTPASLSTREVDGSGVVTVSGGTSNIAVDLGSDSGVTQMPIYNVITNGGENNILVKGPTHIGANVTYGLDGKTNLIFVSGADTSDANLSQTTDLANPNDGISMFGKTFSNGVLLTLQDKEVSSLSNESGKASFLSLAGVSSSAPAFSFTTQRNTATNTDTVNLNGVAVGEIQAIGGTVTQDPAVPQTRTYNVVLNEDAVFAGKIALYGTNQVINLTMEDSSKLFVNNEALHIENLTLNSTKFDVSNILDNSFTQKNIVIDLATDGNDFANISRTKGEYRVLVIGSRTDAGAQPYTTPTGLNGNNGLFRVYVDANGKGTLGGAVVSGGFDDANRYGVYADRILVNNGTAGKHYIQAIYSEDTIIGDIAYHGGGVETAGNIAVATVAKSTGITFEGANQIQGFEVIGTELTDGISTNAQGEKDESGAYKTYFIGSTVSKGVSSSAIQTATSALGINYDLFLANFNSLNKRMGELRDNNHSQGAWARVFVGGLSTSYGLGTQSTYTTIQAGYDYAFGFEGANNYLGVALSYANALTDTKQAFDINGVVSGIDKTTTNGVEVALYNAYVENSGWFNDTIFKFSYMMSDVKVINQSNTYSTNNFGIVLSDEFGYRFKLGESKEWYIDPQLEVGFGYFNQSDLKQVLGQATLDGIQDAIVTLRARVGANWAYDFKNFTQGKGINASVYLGTYYSYDYISGGEINLTTNSGTNTNLTPLSSTGRFEINVGTNIEVQNNTRIYFDFEKSFGGDITTDYQVNLGVRYSFGENAGYTPSNGDKKSVTPLKVNDGNAKESEETQEQASEANKESANSQNNKTEESTEAKSE